MSWTSTRGDRPGRTSAEVGQFAIWGLSGLREGGVITLIVIAAVYGGLFGPGNSDFPAAPWLPRAARAAMLVAIFGGPMFASAGFVLGAPIALLIRADEVGSPP